MNILVLGGTGFFGKHLVWELLHAAERLPVARVANIGETFAIKSRSAFVM